MAFWHLILGIFGGGDGGAAATIGGTATITDSRYNRATVSDTTYGYATITDSRYSRATIEDEAL